MENGLEELSNPELYVQKTPPDVNLRFGTTWVLDEYLKLFSLNKIIDSLPLDEAEKDTFYSLVAFKTFAKELPYGSADNWHTGDYSCILYPKAILYPQSIGIFLKKVGEEYFYRKFFQSYLDITIQNYQIQIQNNNEDNFFPLLIDSTGLINYINTPITAPCSHGGPATYQIRLIYIVDYKSGLPIYFRYVPGNVVDKITLIPTIKELRAYNIPINMLLMDAGYYSKDNIDEMISLELPFILRMPDNTTIFKNIVTNNGPTLKNINNLVTYQSRVLYVQQNIVQISGTDCYAYLCLDPVKEHKDLTNFVYKHYEENTFRDKYIEKEVYFGKFIILSNKDIPKTKIIDYYYARAKIEQIFDTAKNMRPFTYFFYRNSCLFIIF